MKQIISILLFVVAHSANGNVTSLAEFKQANEFQFFVTMEIRDFIYEFDSEYTFMEQCYRKIRTKAPTEKEKIDVVLSRIENARQIWRSEATRMERMKGSYPNLKIIKFVLALPENQKPKLEKQGYLLTNKDELIEVIWDDGLAFYDGITGIKDIKESELPSRATQ